MSHIGNESSMSHTGNDESLMSHTGNDESSMSHTSQMTHHFKNGLLGTHLNHCVTFVENVISCLLNEIYFEFQALSDEYSQHVR